MNREIREYFKNLSKRDCFGINLINCLLGMVVIVMGILGLIEHLTGICYGFMFAAGAVMFILNFYKCSGEKNRNRWLYLIAGIVFAVISVFFFVWSI